MHSNIYNLEKNPIEIAEGIYWVGYTDDNAGLHCNPYLIIEGDEAVLIDGGNRDDFSTVMLKILRTGLDPCQICRLIYQHYDPDLCGNLPQLEAIINRDDLEIISHSENNIFIHYYSKKTPKKDFRFLNHEFVFKTGRKLKFFATPFCHTPGSFVTFDEKTKTLFSSDIFGSYDSRWELFLELNEECRSCEGKPVCAKNGKKCPLDGIKKFHQQVMSSTKAMTHTLDVLESIDTEIIAPQHGSILSSKEDIKAVIRHIRSLDKIGIDYVLRENR